MAKIPQRAKYAKMIKTRFKKAKPQYFFRQWRKYRGFSQEELAELVGVSAPSISQLENGKQGFTDTTLASLAEALNCGPGDLLMRNPLDSEAVWSIWDNVPPERRDQAIKVLRTFADPPKAAQEARKRPGNGKTAIKHH